MSPWLLTRTEKRGFRAQIVVLIVLSLLVGTTLFSDDRLAEDTISWLTGSIMVQSSSPSRTKSSTAAAEHEPSLITSGQNCSSWGLFNNSAAKPQQRQTIRYIHLLGERNSGTNYIGEVLSSAFYPQYHRTVWDTKCRFVCGIPVFQFKHAFRHQLLSSAEIETLQQKHGDVLWILAVRSPCDWADAMYRTPWHMCTSRRQCTDPDQSPVNIAKLPPGVTRAQFWSTFPWFDYKEAVHGNYSTDFSYRNVFALRRHKLMLMQQLVKAMPHRVHIVHLKTVERAPETLVKRLRLQFGLFVNDTAYRPIKPSKKPHSEPLCLNSQEFAIAQQGIDWELESHFGFTPLDCFMCA